MYHSVWTLYTTLSAAWHDWMGECRLHSCYRKFHLRSSLTYDVTGAGRLSANLNTFNLLHLRARCNDPCPEYSSLVTADRLLLCCFVNPINSSSDIGCIRKYQGEKWSPRHWLTRKYEENLSKIETHDSTQTCHPLFTDHSWLLIQLQKEKCHFKVNTNDFATLL